MSGPVVLTIPENGKIDRIRKIFPNYVLKKLAITQLVCGALAAILQILAIADDNAPWHKEFVAHVGAGIWTGLFFGISGGIGLLVATRPSHRNLVAFMVLNIISSVFCLPLIIMASIGFAGYRCGFGKIAFGFQIIIALLQAVVAIVSAAFSCKVVCCCGKKNSGAVVYSQETAAQTQTAMDLLTSNQGDQATNLLPSASRSANVDPTIHQASWSEPSHRYYTVDPPLSSNSNTRFFASESETENQGKPPSYENTTKQ